MRVLLVLTTCLMALSQTACSWQGALDSIPGIYRMDVHQGNIVSQEMVDQLKPGMNKRQVLFVVGTPLLQDPFHDNRWDYFYSNEPNGEERKQRTLTLVFANDELQGIQGDFHPESSPMVQSSQGTTVDIPPIQRDKSLWEWISGLFSSKS